MEIRPGPERRKDPRIPLEDTTPGDAVHWDRDLWLVVASGPADEYRHLRRLRDGFYCDNPGSIPVTPSKAYIVDPEMIP